MRTNLCYATMSFIESSLKGVKMLAVQEQDSLKNVSYFKTIHHDSKGIICLAYINPSLDQEGRFKAKFGRLSTLQKCIGEDEVDIYFSQNTFKKCSRRIENLCEITSCYVDIDYYKMGFTKEQTLGNIELLVEDGEIPKPTFIIDSGRGLYAIWHLKRLPKQALSLWRSFQQYLYTKLEHIGADRMSLDAARILRVDGSINSKVQKKVEVITHCPLRYDLHQLEKDYMPEIYNEKFKKKTKRKSRSKILYYYNQYSLHYERITDLVNLCQLRDFDLKSYHQREIILFLYRYWSCCYTSNTEQALEDVLELNSQFLDPLPSHEVKRATHSAERAYQDRKYNYKNQTLIEMLGITEEEQAQLKTIIGTQEKYARKNKKRNKERRCEKGLTKREKQKLNTIFSVLDLKDAGYTQNEVKKKLELSIRTVKNYWNIERSSIVEQKTFFKIAVGKKRGTIIIADSIDTEDGILTSDKGERYLLEQLAPLTETEINECFKIVPIDLNA